MASRIAPRPAPPPKKLETSGLEGPLGEAIKQAVEKRAKEQTETGAPGVGGPIKDLFERGTPPPLGGPIGGLLQPGGPPAGGLLGGPISAGLLGVTGGKFPEPTPRQRAEKAISSTQAPPADHPYRQHVEGVHQQLRDAGLPDSAEGVRVKVVGDGPGHAESVARSVGGNGSGIAPGADLSIHYQLPHDARPPGFALNDREAGFLLAPADDIVDRAFKGEVTTGELVERGARDQVGAVHDMRQELAQVRADQPDDGKLTIANMSWGTTVARAAERATNTALLAPEGSPMHKEISAILGHAPTDDDRPALSQHFARQIQGKLDGEFAGDMRSARAKLGDELKAARGENILFVSAVGNEGESAAETGVPGASRHPAAGVEGLLLVGSTHLGEDPRSAADDRSSPFTNQGANLSAPGDDVPVDNGADSLFGKMQGALGGLGGPLAGARPARNTDGTSFASPYVAGVAALMSKANPALNADQIASILTSPAAHNAVGGTSVGGIDPVKAVELAAQAR